MSIVFTLDVGMSKVVSAEENTDNTVKADDTKDADKSSDKSQLELTFSKTGGVYKSAFNLTISCSGKAEIYYTTDGSNPLTSKTKKLYTAPIKVADRSKDKNYVSAVDPTLFDAANVRMNTKKDGFVSTVSKPADSAVDKCTVIRAVALDEQGLYTDVVTNTYFIGSMTSHIPGIAESAKAAGTGLELFP
jgi:hypothetical protein